MKHSWMTDPAYTGPRNVQRCRKDGCLVRRCEETDGTWRYQETPRTRWLRNALGCRGGESSGATKATRSPILDYQWTVDKYERVAHKDGRGVHRSDPGALQAWAAAPDMARALLAFVRGMDSSEQGVQLEGARLLADAALLKAGVSEEELRTSTGDSSP